MSHVLLHFNKEVTDAISTKKPIVVLESAISSHGLPYPDNFATSQMVEQIIRDNGAVPATIAIYQGKIHIGTDPSVMQHIASHINVLMKISIFQLI